MIEDDWHWILIYDAALAALRNVKIEPEQDPEPPSDLAIGRGSKPSDAVSSAPHRASGEGG